MKLETSVNSKLLRRIAQLVLLAAVALLFLGADVDARFNKLGHQMMCMCGCNQVLLECNHVGCAYSDRMRNELTAGLERGDSDSLILQSFVQKYGNTVLAAPTTSGFNIVAWIMPFAVFALAYGAGRLACAFVEGASGGATGGCAQPGAGRIGCPAQEGAGGDGILMHGNVCRGRRDSETPFILFGCALFAAALFVYMFYEPGDMEQGEAKTRYGYLQERKEATYENLRDLNFEYKAGKLSEEDYAMQRAALEDEAAAILAEMEAIEEGTRQHRAGESMNGNSLSPIFQIASF